LSWMTGRFAAIEAEKQKAIEAEAIARGEESAR